MIATEQSKATMLSFKIEEKISVVIPTSSVSDPFYFDRDPDPWIRFR